MRLGGQLLWGAGEGTAGSALTPEESRMAGGVGRKWPLTATAPWGGYSLAVKNLL